MKVAILGLGYVGTVAGACLAARGHDIVGVDLDPAKVELMRLGKPSFVEPGLERLLADGVAQKRLTASSDTQKVLSEAEVVIVTVGTPTGTRGRPDLRAVEGVASEIGMALRSRTSPLAVVLRSTVLPGTTRDLFIPKIEAASGKKHGQAFTCVFSPEFLREGCAVDDFDKPPQTLVGALSDSDASEYLRLLEGIAAPTRITSLEVAELMKYACNCFHAVKIAFANEVGALANAVGADGREAMALLCEDTVLNISKAYMRPGNAFGGSCLPKDLRGLTHLALEKQMSVPLLGAVLSSNDAQIRRIVDAVRDTRPRTVGVVGLAFKDDTDDLRESPMVQMVRELLLGGIEVKVYDPAVQQSQMRGKNLQFAQLGIPDLSTRLVADLPSLVAECDTLLTARKSLGTVPPDAFGNKPVVDLVGVKALEALPGYLSVCW
jgi:GDP-mannose 6-dehydrogenase